MAIPRPRYNSKRKRKTGKFKRGYYEPLTENGIFVKYVQPSDKTMNSSILPEYRSSWEKVFMEWCDRSPDVLKWSTESIAIPYLSPKDNKVHRYFPDFFIYFKDGRKVIVEIKPYNQQNNPINQAKWEQAEKYAKSIGAKFVVVTEKELKSWGLLKK